MYVFEGSLLWFEMELKRDQFPLVKLPIPFDHVGCISGQYSVAAAQTACLARCLPGE
jgi:hypothetical protein